MTKPAATIVGLLDELRSTAWDERDKGDLFERLMQQYLRTDPLYRDRYAEVWRWADWPDRPGPDTGIDLVAREAGGGGLCAIQCKFYAPDHVLQKSDIDSFFTASGKAGFASRMIVSTTDRWSKNAEDALEGQQIPMIRLRVADLDTSGVDWSTFDLAHPTQMAVRAPKTVRPHQQRAIDAVATGLAEANRGKLIMACGTGKTFTSLRIVERLVEPGGKVLVLVPSISLLSQTLKEWSLDATVPLRTFAVCSDRRAGRRTKSEDIGAYDLAFPATTDADRLVAQLSAAETTASVTVVFSTYQSIGTVAVAQAAGAGTFDLVVCDEAHRTTGVTAADEDGSAFTAVHDNDYLDARRRLYMTATPRIYEDTSKSQAAEIDAVVYSMDDEATYGAELYRLGFGEAVAAGLLADYRVVVLAVDETYVSKVFQTQLADQSNELRLDDAARVVGCWNGLAKRGAAPDTFGDDISPMRRAVAFSRSIKDSKRFTDRFDQIVTGYTKADSDDSSGLLACEVEHVDGTFNALARGEKLDWLQQPAGPGHCRVLSNARCLSEGVDVPALDAVMFLNPRNSVVDVVQSVGRVMRRAPGKTYGYVILPIGIPADLRPEDALRDNARYKVVWQVLQALRAHDDRFNAMINKIDLNRNPGDQLQVIGVPDPSDNGDTGGHGPAAVQGVLDIPHLAEWRDAIYAKIVQKVGDRRYWETWASDVSDVAARHTARINALLAGGNPEVAATFGHYLEGLRANLNDSITQDQAVEMLSQHSVTRPVFEALFDDYAFAEHNPVSVVMQGMLDLLEVHNVDAESDDLVGFYDSVRSRAEGIDNAQGKQRIVTELYEKFFKLAFPGTADALGIVYTPVEIVDFILHSVEDVLARHFDLSINDPGVHLIDPFSGTGTFLARLLDSDLIRPERLPDKYLHDLHANEIVLLAYYIAAVNIEAAYYGRAGGDYQPFEGIVLTDTFQSSEAGDPMDEVFFPQNNARLVAQQQTDITVVVGNPPYSVGQESENDNNRNMAYPTLDRAIRDTYTARSAASSKRTLYDSYVRAFRWATDRIGDRGVIAYVTNGSFIDTKSFDGFRRTLIDEFTAIYCLNLRGNQRGTMGDSSQREGGKIFGGGSAPVAVTLLVKNPDASERGRVYYRDIGDYLPRENKLAKVAAFGHLDKVEWEQLTLDDNGDWINQRDPNYQTFPPLGGNQPAAGSIFDLYSLGVSTNRDAWTYNFSRPGVRAAVSRLVAFYNDELDRYRKARTGDNRAAGTVDLDRFVDPNPRKISWSAGLKSRFRKGEQLKLRPEAIRESMYRPYCKQWLYFDRSVNERVYRLPKLFPTGTTNVAIHSSAGDARRPFSALMVNVIPNLHLHDSGQTFPLYRYEDGADGTLFDEARGPIRRDAISDTTLDRFRSHCDDATITKLNVFYYVYGVLHSHDYRARYAVDLHKAIPRIPYAEDFWAFSEAGRRLGDLHVGYETVEPWPLDGHPDRGADPSDLRVEKMRFPKRADRSAIIFNSKVTLAGIPLETYDYQVNGRSALEWIMDRYQITVDKNSGIRNDPNQWSDDPRYVVDLVARVVRVSIETDAIVNRLPALD